MAYTPQKKVIEWLSSIFDAVQHVRTLSAVRGVANDLRVSVLNTVPVSGTVTATGTVAVSTVTTVTNQAQTGGLNNIQIVPATQNINAVLSNINNITIS